MSHFRLNLESNSYNIKLLFLGTNLAIGNQVGSIHRNSCKIFFQQNIRALTRVCHFVMLNFVCWFGYRILAATSSVSSY